MIVHIDAEYGPGARSRLAEAASPDLDGARAALESFYHAFNHRDLQVGAGAPSRLHRRPNADDRRR